MRFGLAVTSCVLLLIPASLFISGTNTYGTAIRPGVDTKIREILSDSTLWGDDFPALLANIRSWRRSGETRIEIFQNEAVGATPQANIRLALSAAARLHFLMKESPRFRTNFEAVLKRRAADVNDSVVPSAQTSRDDIWWRVVMVKKSSAAQTLYLAPGLTMAKVQERSGPPESVTTRLIDSGDERRPLILKLYNYAQGSIAFAESNISPTPGTVDRVILDTTRISGVIF